MANNDRNKIVDNLALFLATYLLATEPKIPSYKDGEEAWVNFLREGILHWFEKQPNFQNATFTKIDKYVKPDDELYDKEVYNKILQQMEKMYMEKQKQTIDKKINKLNDLLQDLTTNRDE